MSANKCFVSHKTVEHRKDTCYDFYHLEFKYNDSSKEASCLLSYGSQECESYSADQYLLKGLYNIIITKFIFLVPLLKATAQH